MRSETDFISQPLALSCEQLVACATYSHSAARLRAGENLLYGGGFEDLGQMTQFGWKHVNRPVPGIDAQPNCRPFGRTSVNSVFNCPWRLHRGSLVRRTVSSPAVWIVSPGVPVMEGQVVEITGWVRVDRPIAGSVDGLQIADTLGGPELALAIRQTSGWQQFQMLRAVPQSTELHVSFALAGFGSASVDGVMVRTLDRPRIRRLPPVSLASDGMTNTANAAGDSGPLFVAPGAR